MRVRFMRLRSPAVYGHSSAPVDVSASYRVSWVRTLVGAQEEPSACGANLQVCSLRYPSLSLRRCDLSIGGPSPSLDPRRGQGMRTRLSVSHRSRPMSMSVEECNVRKSKANSGVRRCSRADGHERGHGHEPRRGACADERGRAWEGPDVVVGLLTDRGRWSRRGRSRG